MHGLSVSTPHTDIRPMLRSAPSQPLVHLADGLDLLVAAAAELAPEHRNRSG